MNTIYNVYFVEQNKENTLLMHVTYYVERIFGKQLRLVLNVISFYIFNLSFRSMRELSKESFSLHRQMQYMENFAIKST